MEDRCSQESCECLHPLKSTAQQCPGVGDLVTMGMRQTLLSPLRLSGKGNWMMEGRADRSRIRHVPHLRCPLIASLCDYAWVNWNSVKKHLIATFESLEKQLSVISLCRRGRKRYFCDVRAFSGVSRSADLSCHQQTRRRRNNKWSQESKGLWS